MIADMTPERLDEIEAGLHGLPDDSWSHEPHGSAMALYSGRTAERHGYRLLNLVDGDMHFQKIIAHIARLDPGTVLALVRMARRGMEVAAAAHPYINRMVVYRSYAGAEPEQGVITAISKKPGTVFVRYGTQCGSQMTSARDLTFLDGSPVILPSPPEAT